MTPKQGMARLKKLLGPNAKYREHEGVFDPKTREAAREALPKAQADLKRAEKLMYKRERQIWKDPEYVRLKNEVQRLEDEVCELSGVAWQYRLEVGLHNGFSFHIEAMGDSWDEVIEKLERSEHEFKT